MTHDEERGNKRRGEIRDSAPSNNQLWQAFEQILTAPKTSTYKFVWLQALIDLSSETTSRTYSFFQVFTRFTELYWDFLIRYDLPQIRKNKRYNSSMAEKFIRNVIAQGNYTKDTSFSQIMDDTRTQLLADIEQYCTKDVVKAVYADSDGLLYCYSLDDKQLELSEYAHTFLAVNKVRLSTEIRISWLEMVENLSEAPLPELLATELESLKMHREVMLSPDADSFDDLDSPMPGKESTALLDQLKRYIVSSCAKLNEQAASLNVIASEIDRELRDILADCPLKKLSVSTRVKESESLGEKVFRKNYYVKHPTPEDLIAKLPDIIGARIVCLLNHEEKDVYQYLLSVLQNQVILDKRTFYYRPGTDRLFLALQGQPEHQKNGQEIYRISGKWKNQDKKYVNFELQIKSSTHNFWGEAEHMLFYKNYSYLISSPFYRKLMEQINSYLENIDTQLGILRDQIERSGDSEKQEIRQIASMLMYEQYHTSVKELLGYTIDLREVFELLVDTYFRDRGNRRQNIEILTEFVSYSTHTLQTDLVSRLPTMVFERDNYPNRILPLAEAIDGELKTGDIYWLFFVGIYASHFMAEDQHEYNNILLDISKKLHLMASIRSRDAIEQIDEEMQPIYSLFEKEIASGIVDVFVSKPKLDFFLLHIRMGQVHAVSENIARTLQQYITPENRDSLESNMEVVRHYTHCSIAVQLYNSVSYDDLKKLQESLSLSDVFALCSSLDELEKAITKLDVSDNMNKEQFASLFPRREGN